MTKKEFFLITTFWLIWQVSLFFIGRVSDSFLRYSPTFPYFDNVLVQTNQPRWLYSWANFDGVHYLAIANYGYIGTGLVQAFLPFFPFVILHSAHLLCGDGCNILLTGLAVTQLFSYGLALIWFAFVKKFQNKRVAWLALFGLYLFPTSFFLNALYTESIFLFATILAFWAERQKNWPLMGVATAIAVSTRVVGVFLIPALILDILISQSWPKSATYYIKHPLLSANKVGQVLLQYRWAVAWLVFSLLGLLYYMSFLLHEFHDPFYFIHVQTQFNTGRQSEFILYPQVLWRSLKILMDVRPFDWHYFAYAQEFMVGCAGLLALLWSFKSVRVSYVFFALAAFLLPTTTGTFSSMPRYVLVCFPLFIVLAKMLQKRPLLMILWFAVSTVLLVINTVLFIQGYWVA